MSTLLWILGLALFLWIFYILVISAVKKGVNGAHHLKGIEKQLVSIKDIMTQINEKLK